MSSDHVDESEGVANDSSYLQQDAEATYRMKLQDLIDNLQSNRSELVNPESGGLDEHIEELTAIFSQMHQNTNATDRTHKATTITQATLDFKAFGLLASINHERIKSIVASSWVFRPKDFAQKVVMIASESSAPAASEEEPELSEAGKLKLQEVISPYFQKLVSPWRPMLGAFNLDDEEDGEVTQVKQRRRAAASQQSQAVREVQPLAVSSSGNQQSEKSVEDQIVHVKRLLRRYIAASKAPVPYYNFVVDPNSFARTVENIFHVSFLIKDGEVSLLEDENELPVLNLTDKGRDQGNASLNDEQSHSTKSQIIINMSMDFWEELVEVLQLQEPMITYGDTRSKSQRR